MVKPPLKKSKPSSLVPEYKVAHWTPAKLPSKVQDWSLGGGRSIAPDGDGPEVLYGMLDRLNKNRAWRWPKRRHFFMSDLHGDPEAFVASLVASSGVKRTGQGHRDFQLTSRGRDAVFIIGGDCFDKGPSSLELLRSIHHLIGLGARVRLLAGNHDIRLLLGMNAVGLKKDVYNDHFFIRTGQKIIPLLKEIWDEYLQRGSQLNGVPSKKECRKRLYPGGDWYDVFPFLAKGVVRPAQIKRELQRIRNKQDRFERLAADHGLSLRQVYACVQQWKKLFVEKDGEFSWFFQRIRLAYRSGSFLFVHAGLDNDIARDLNRQGVKDLNRAFRKAIIRQPFDFYYGSLCNMIRTKYRDVDMPFSKGAAKDVHRAGFAAVIHGHRNLHHGQRLAGRKGLLHFECDASLDSHTRKNEKVRGRGAAVTIIEPKGRILGVSSDHPYIKVFDPVITTKALKSMSMKRAKR